MRTLLTPRWVVAHVVVLVVGLVMVGLGFWQLSRLEERRLLNTVMERRYGADPAPLYELVDGAAGDLDSLEFRRATATGEYDTASELLVRSQVRNGTAGYEVLTPFQTSAGMSVLVNRGWVPLELDTPPVTAAAPEEGTITIEGVVKPSQQRGIFGRDDTGRPESDVLSRVDLSVAEERIGEDLAPVYLEVVGDATTTRLPVPASPPDFDDEGPHLGYAIQWFSFALVGVVGYGALIRRALRRHPGPR